MSLNPPQSGLRRLQNHSKQTAKVTVYVAPGDELIVSDDVANQLVAGDRNAFASEELQSVDGPEVDMVDEDLEEQLRADARSLGIKRVGNKSVETLQKEIDELKAGSED